MERTCTSPVSTRKSLFDSSPSPPPRQIGKEEDDDVILISPDTSVVKQRKGLFEEEEEEMESTTTTTTSNIAAIQDRFDEERLELLTEIQHSKDRIQRRDKKIKKLTTRLETLELEKQELVEKMKGMHTHEEYEVLLAVVNKLKDSTVEETAVNEELSEQGPKTPKKKNKKNKAKKKEKHHNLMNEYMESRAASNRKKEKELLERDEEDRKWIDMYNKEWELLAGAERKRKQTRRKKRGQPLKNVRVSQHRQSRQRLSQQNIKHFHSSRDEKNERDVRTVVVEEEKEESVDTLPKEDKEWSDSSDDSNVSTSSPSSSSSDDSSTCDSSTPPPPPLPLEPTMSEAERVLYERQKKRVDEYKQQEELKTMDAEKADSIRSDIHDKVVQWAIGKDIVQLLLTLHSFSSLPALQNMHFVHEELQRPEGVRKAYR